MGRGTLQQAAAVSGRWESQRVSPSVTSAGSRASPACQALPAGAPPLPPRSVFTCKLQSKTVDSYGATHIRTARLHLVDLAGRRAAALDALCCLPLVLPLLFL